MRTRLWGQAPKILAMAHRSRRCRFLNRGRLTLVQIARCLVCDAIDVAQWWRRLQTHVHVMIAARIKATAALGVQAHFFLARQHQIGIPAFFRVRHRDRVDQLLHVGMLGILDHLGDVALFGDGALIQNVDVVARSGTPCSGRA